MRAVKLSVEPFEFIHIVELESERGLNRHGVLRLTGLISQERRRNIYGRRKRRHGSA